MGSSDDGIRPNDAPAAATGAARQRKAGVLNGMKDSMKEASNSLMQQRLKSWQPVMSPKYVCSCTFW